MTVFSSSSTDTELDLLSIPELEKQLHLQYQHLQQINHALACKKLQMRSRVPSSVVTNGLVHTIAIKAQPTQMLTPYFETTQALSDSIESILDSSLMDSAGKSPEPMQPLHLLNRANGLLGPRTKFYTRQMVIWALANMHYPYPSREMKEQFATDSGMTFQQVSHWFVNWRKRYLKRVKCSIFEDGRFDGSSHFGTVCWSR